MRRSPFSSVQRVSINIKFQKLMKLSIKISSKEVNPSLQEGKYVSQSLNHAKLKPHQLQSDISFIIPMHYIVANMLCIV